jgi:hypothetical protein
VHILNIQKEEKKIGDTRKETSKRNFYAGFRQVSKSIT